MAEKVVKELGMNRAVKLAEAADKGIVTKTNIDKWVENAKKTTAEGLVAMLNVKEAENKEAEKPGSKPATKKNDSIPETLIPFRCLLFEEQSKIWNLALDKAAAITKSDKKAWHVECIAQHFLSEGCDKPVESLRLVCARLEKLYGVQLIARDKEKGEWVYGENLVELAEEALKDEK